MANHSVVPRVKRFVKIFRSDSFCTGAPSQKQFIGRNQHRANDSLFEMIETAAKSQNKDEAPKEIAKVVQTFSEFGFQIFGTRNFPVASIEDAKCLKYRRSDQDADIIAAFKKYGCDERQNKNRRRERAGMNRELHEHTRYAARNRPIQKSRNKTVLWLTHRVEILVKAQCYWLIA